MQNNPSKLLKAGELARHFGFLASTIRYYTNIGLLTSDSRSQGGYHLYNFERSKEIIQKINNLKQKRYTLDEIKNKLVVNN